MFCKNGISDICCCLVVLPRMVVILTVIVVPVMNGHAWDQTSVHTSQAAARQRDMGMGARIMYVIISEAKIKTSQHHVVRPAGTYLHPLVQIF